jgi:hypothetical protein
VPEEPNRPSQSHWTARDSAQFFSLPATNSTTQRFSRGSHYLNQLDRAVISSLTRDIGITKTVEGSSGKPGFMWEHTCASDILHGSPPVCPIRSRLPDANGLLRRIFWSVHVHNRF